jgi:DNA-entry nuclease
VQPGIEIDYATGDSSVSEESKDTAKESGETIEEKGETKESEAEDSSVILIGADTESTTEANSETKTVVSGEDEERTYILNTNSKKIHLPTCSSVNDMAEKNKQECESSISELKKKGYEPCGRCLAEYR